MNKSLSYILVGGASALIGGIAGYIFCKKKLENEFKDAVSEKVNEELRALRRMRGAPLDLGFPLGESKGEKGCDGPFDYIAYAKGVIRDMFPNATLNEYRLNLVATCLMECDMENLNDSEMTNRLEELFASFESPQDDIPEEDLGISYEEDNIQAVMDDYASHPPHVISEDEYAALPPAFDFLTYKYFEDDILIDDGEDIVTNVEELVGDALVQFGDGDTVYVLNGKQAMAIEIIRMNCSYQAWSGLGEA